MIRIVLDTNVLISGMINPHGAPGRIVDLVREGIVELVVDDRILAEYSDVLNRPKFKSYFQSSDAQDILVFLSHSVHYVVSITHVTDIPDLDDAPFLEVALTAEVTLVTGNAPHFPVQYRNRITISSPAEFICHHNTNKEP